MFHSHGALRPARWGAAMAIAAVGALGFATGANAAIFRPADGAALQTAILAANANGPGRDTIVLPATLISPTTQLFISSDLLITSDHATQAASNLATIDGS